jgi:hypothetical protein
MGVSASNSAVSSRFMIADGFSAACGPGARAYFVAFWAFGVLVGWSKNMESSRCFLDKR